MALLKGGRPSLSAERALRGSRQSTHPGQKPFSNLYTMYRLENGSEPPAPCCCSSAWSRLKLGGLNVACVQKQAAPGPHQFKAVPDRPAVAGVAGPGLSPARGDRVMRDQAQRSRSLRIRDSGDSRQQHFLAALLPISKVVNLQGSRDNSRT